MEFSTSLITTNTNLAGVTLASGAVICRGNEVLLSKDTKDDFWKFPGGRVDDNESFRQTAIREAKEESGLDIVIDDSVKPIVHAIHKETEGVVKYYILIHYSCTKFIGELQPQDDSILEVKFFNLNELPDDLAPNVLPVINML